MPIDWFPLWLSLRVAVLSTAIALAAGLWIAYILANREFRGKEVLDAAVTLPLVLPPTVLGYYLLVLIGRNSPLGKLWEGIFGSPLVFTWKAAVVAALMHSFPLLVKSAERHLKAWISRYERAATNIWAHRNGDCSGASPCRWRAGRSSPPRRSRLRDRWGISASR